MEEIGLSVGFILTLMVYSYLIRDNFLYRLAVYIFVGLTAAYVSIVTIESVLIPWFDSTINQGGTPDLLIGLLPVVLGTLLLLKTSPRLAQLGNIGMAFIVGIGAAVALVGAVTGTLIPLALSTMNAGTGHLLDTVLVFIGVVSSLIYFQYLSRRLPDGGTTRPRLIEGISQIGRGFIVITLGALYGSVIITTSTIFSERISFILGQF